MRPIRKSQEPPELAEFRAEIQSQNTTPSWDDLNGPDWAALRAVIDQRLRQDQHWLCCYCGCEIGPELAHPESGHPGRDHKEHFRPRSKFPDLIFDWSNLLSSCGPASMRGQPHTCGGAKGEEFPDGLISPLEPNCDQRFRYLEDGKIAPARQPDSGAEVTIACLNLNEPGLCRRRRAVLQTFLARPDQVDSEVYRQDLRRLSMALCSPNEAGKLHGFSTAVLRSIEDLLDDRAEP